MAKAKAITALFETMTDVENAMNDMTGLTASTLVSGHLSLITQKVKLRKIHMATVDWTRNTILESNRTAELLLGKEPVEGMGIGSQIAAVPVEIIEQLGYLSTADTEEIGPVIVAGPLFFSLANNAENPAPQKLTEVIKKLGFSEEEAKLYIEGIRRGYTMIVVFTSGSHADKDAQEAVDLLERHHPIDISKLVEEPARAAGESTPFETVEVVTRRSIAEERGAEVHGGTTERATKEREIVAFESYDSAFRSHFEKTYGNYRIAYETFLPAYRYGYNLATSSRYQGRDWESIEPEVRERWESRNPGTWDDFKDAIYEGWHQVHEEEHIR